MQCQIPLAFGLQLGTSSAASSQSQLPCELGVDEVV